TACNNQDGNTRQQADNEADVTLIQLRDPLDEPEYYCVDVPGFGSSLNLEGALTAHTCKPNADDELFIINQPNMGHLYMPAYDRCMEAAAQEVGAELKLTDCSDSPLQQFTFSDDGTIQLQNTAPETLCLSVADEDGEPTGGPSHVRRDLLLQTCGTVDAALSQWEMPGSEIP
ncbi:MAG: RICIN domain-containing protein, partial [Chloroflexota bacterium]